MVARVGVLIAGGLKVGGTGLEKAARQALIQVTAEVANLRGLITELRPAASTRWASPPRSRGWRGDAGAEGLEVDLDTSLGIERLGPELETAVYRLVQQAWTNVAKHAGAKRVKVSVVRIGDRVRAEVSDDGCGFDAARPGAGFGLVGMAERASLMGGGR